MQMKLAVILVDLIDEYAKPGGKFHDDSHLPTGMMENIPEVVKAAR